MLQFSDLHLREESAEVVLGEVLPGIRDACHQHGERELGFLGDWYHLRYRLDVRIQNAVRDWLYKVTSEGIHVYFLPGNHDQVDYAGRHALEVFEGMRGVTIFHVPTWTHHGLWIPYRKRKEDIEAALLTPLPAGINAYPRVLFMHHGVQGALMNDRMPDTDGLPQAMFQGWSRIICGHYHKRQQLGPLTYIGSPWQTKSDEAGQPKGYAIWDGSSGALTFYDTTWGPRYFNIEVREPCNGVDLTNVRPQDIVRVTTAPGVDPSKIGAQLAAAHVQGTVTPEVVVAEARISLPEGSSLESYATEYVRLSDTKLDKGNLMKLFQEVSRG